MIDRETVQKIKDAANIVDVVSDYVHLVRRGANYMGLCPFHNERTPSFSVSPKKNFCHCFSCKKGGSPVNFIMEKEGISYHEALLRLAKKYNIHVEERELTEEERQRMSEREAMIVASEWAMNLFHHNLYNTEEGRDVGLSYLYGRGITDEAIKKYRLGYSMERGNELLKKAVSEGFDIEVFKKIGLVGTSQEGRDYDKFRGRVMFPIRNSSGKPIAFGGRALRGEPAKYINSPESPIYKKSNELYGIFEAKNDIVNRERVFLMEGYLDVIGSWQGGIGNAIASSGTSLTDGQIALLHRFTDNVTLVYDGDSAGIKASLRGIDMLLAHKLHIEVLLLPEGEDPDSFARKHTTEEFQKYVEENSTDFIDFKSKVLLKDAGNSSHARSAAVQSVVESISCIPNEIERAVYIQKCSRLMNIDERIITQQVNRMIYAKGAEQKKRFSPQPQQEAPHAGSPTTDAPQDPAAQTPAQNLASPKSHLNKFEKEIIKYCVRYAYLPVVDEEITTVEAFAQAPTAIEYIDEEFAADSISFSNPAINKVFLLLKDHLGIYRELLASRIKTLNAEQEEKAREFYNRLGMSGGSMASIRKAEQEFESRQEVLKIEELKRLAMQTSVDLLINHEDNDIRHIATPLVEDRHQLSVIFRKDGDTVEEADKLNDLLFKAMAELRNEMLNDRIKDITDRLTEANRSGARELQEQLMRDLANLLKLRSKFAKNLGERIISPR